MKKKFFVLVYIYFMSLCSYAQKDIQEAWDMFHKAKPINESSLEWKKAGEVALSEPICISGNCENGFGIRIDNLNGKTPRYQFEGKFVNGIKTSYGVTTRQDIKFATLGDLQIVLEDDLYTLSRPSKRGFTLNEILYFQNLSFAKYNQCNCLIPTYNHRENYNYSNRYEIVNGWGEHVDWKYENKTGQYKTEGLLNTTDNKIFVRAYSKKRIPNYIGSSPIEYFDESFIIWPEKSMIWVDFDYKPFDNGKKVTTSDITIMDTEEAEAKGFGEYIRFVGQYTLNKSLVNSCFQEQLAISKVAKNIGNSTYLVDAYTRTANIIVKKGDKISIVANGSIIAYNADNEGVLCNPEGIDESFLSSYSIVEEFNFGSLLASVGEECDWKFVGKRLDFEADCDGELYLMINDDYPADNKGKFKVMIKIIKAKK